MILTLSRRAALWAGLLCLLGAAWSQAQGKPGKMSYTALAVCGLRALGARDPDPKTRNPDYLAEKFLPPGFLTLLWGLSDDFELAVAMLRGRSARIFYYISARTRFIDETLVAAVRSGCRQVVILGAGFDSRAYRFRSAWPGLRFFEVDLPATGAVKIAKVKQIFGAIPPGVSHVAIDFNKQSLAQVLGAVGYRRDVKTFFIWEGVTYYLSAQGVDSTLRFIAQGSAPGSRLVFDYMLHSLVAGGYKKDPRTRELFRRVAARGEPYRFGIKESQIKAYLRQRGLRLLEHLGRDEMLKRFLISSNGAVYGQPPRFLRLVQAEVMK